VILDSGGTNVDRDSVLEFFLRSLASPDDNPGSVREYSSVLTELANFHKPPTEPKRTI
jgi:hypothetical protein